MRAPADGEHLLLPAGQGARLLSTALGEDGKEAVDALQRLPDAPAVHFDVGAHLEVLEHGHLGKDDAALRHIGEPARQHLVRAQAGDLLAVEDDPAARGADEAHDGLEGGGLARAVGTDHAHHLARVHLERDLVEDGDLAVARGQPFREEEEIRHGRRPHI
jgi:hypothetical protein